MAIRSALEEKLAEIENMAARPRLLLHSCCAPCASYVLEYLIRYFSITLFFFNPNIATREEYFKRASELNKLPDVGEDRVEIIIYDYDTAVYINRAAPYADEPEGGQRCRECFMLRLEETAKTAAEGRYDYFTTTLSVSPHKDAGILNELGGRLAGEYKTEYLFSDFKKRDGYKRSIELSKQYSLYRQNYCGCAYSLMCREKAFFSGGDERN